MLRMNPEYEYHFYNDADIDTFMLEEFGAEIFKQYSKLAIGAAKADFFRYAILLKKGGIYLDIDSKVSGKLDSWISKSDKAIITEERNPGFYVQWALIYEKGHPFLAKTLEIILDNIRTNRYPNDVHKMTGPTVYSNAVKQCIKEDTTIPFRMLGVDYEGEIKFKYWLSGFSFNRKEHWRESQKVKGVLKPQ